MTALERVIALACGIAIAGCSIDARFAPVLPSHSYLSTLRPDAVKYRLLYSFAQNGKPSDGNSPVAKLLTLNGKLYGTTLRGGATSSQCGVGCGTIFQMDTSGHEVVLYRFKNGGDGVAPAAGLLRLNGSFFGTTSAGGTGSACPGGCGTVFKTDSTGKIEGAIYSFKGARDGESPLSDLAVANGALYGTTEYGGLAAGACFSGCGTIFKMSATGKEQVIYRFKGGNDGAIPLSRLTFVNGALYGTTQYGGARTAFCSVGCGTVFRVDVNGKEKVLYRFRYAPHVGDGAYPVAGVVALNGAFYGATFVGGSSGSGTIFRMSPTGAERVLHTFACCRRPDDGAHPAADLTNLNGVLYGTTRDGGVSGRGTVFKVTTSGAESVLYSFAGKPDGATPRGRLIVLNGTLFGTTSAGGSTGEGSVFALRP
jgi:uncharacterized repeat protein (TIGR03803 family)